MASTPASLTPTPMPTPAPTPPRALARAWAAAVAVAVTTLMRGAASVLRGALPSRAVGGARVAPDNDGGGTQEVDGAAGVGLSLAAVALAPLDALGSLSTSAASDVLAGAAPSPVHVAGATGAAVAGGRARASARDRDRARDKRIRARGRGRRLVRPDRSDAAPTSLFVSAVSVSAASAHGSNATGAMIVFRPTRQASIKLSPTSPTLPLSQAAAVLSPTLTGASLQ